MAADNLGCAIYISNMASPLQIRRSRTIWPLLVRQAATQKTVTYKELGEQVGVHPRALRFALELIQDKCRDSNFPPLTTLVVNSYTGLPGAGNRIHESDFEKAVKSVFLFDWKVVSNPFTEPDSDNTNAWWLNNSLERYWLESTDRKDLGKNLIAPISSHAGQKLVSYVEDGDIVLHYDQTKRSIVAISMAQGSPFRSEIRWPDRKKSKISPAYEMKLAFFSELPTPIALSEIHLKDKDIREIRSELDTNLEGGSAYFPFQVPVKNVIQPSQGMYLSKVPKKLFDLFPEFQSFIDLNWPQEILLTGAKDSQSLQPSMSRSPRSQRSQGRDNDPERRILVEVYAMKLATEHLRSNGFEVEDVSMIDGLGYDIRAIKESIHFGVEVKGSRSSVNSVDVTRSEVDYAQNARSQDLQTILIVVDEIQINGEHGNLRTSGGRLRLWLNWDAHESLLFAKTFSYKLPEV